MANEENFTVNSSNEPGATVATAISTKGQKRTERGVKIALNFPHTDESISPLSLTFSALPKVE